MNREYVTAMYLRISNEDAKKRWSESESISGQRILVRDFIENQQELLGCTIIEVVDDGYSGTNFERPGINRLLHMLKKRLVHCIVVKDFSRFGRNYLEVGNYLEQVFPLLGVRFISINDNFDSFKNFGAAGAIDVGFKNIVYEAYSNDLSVKIRSARRMKAEQGKFVTALAPYGYKKDEHDKNHLIIEEKYAVVVRLIYTLFLQGVHKTDIARKLNQAEIPSPAMSRNNNKKESHWTAAAVSRILSDQRYTGDAVYGKVMPPTVGSKKDAAVPRKDWIVVEHSHEAIVTREVFEQILNFVPTKTDEYVSRLEKKAIEKLRTEFERKR